MNLQDLLLVNGLKDMEILSLKRQLELLQKENERLNSEINLLKEQKEKDK